MASCKDIRLVRRSLFRQKGVKLDLETSCNNLCKIFLNWVWSLNLTQYFRYTSSLLCIHTHESFTNNFKYTRTRATFIFFSSICSRLCLMNAIWWPWNFRLCITSCMYICRQNLFSSVAQSCPTLCDPMNCSTPGLPVHHQLPEFTQTHVHRAGDAIQPSHPLSSPSPPAPKPSQHQSLFQWVNSSHEVAKVLECQL